MVFRRKPQEPPRPRLPKIEPLAEGEVGWRDSQLEVARLLAKRYTGDTETLPTIERLDLTVAGWLTDDPSRVDMNTLVNGVGIAFGQHLVDAARLDWVIATDEHGSDLALHGQPGDIVIYPANATAKRVVAGERSFLGPLFVELLQGVSRQRQTG